MLNIALIIIVHLSSLGLVDTGYISQFAKSPTDGTLHYRQYESMELDPDIPYDGYIAVKDCSRVGDEAFLKLEYDDYSSDWLHVAVFDCSGHVSTSEWMDSDNIIAEVDWYTAEEHGFLGRGGVVGDLVWIGEFE